LTVTDSTSQGRVRDRYRPAEFEAERYSTENLSFWTPVIVRLGGIDHHNEVLDLGCATGGLTAALAEATGAHLVGCDRSIALLDYGRRECGRASTPLVRGDGARLPFRSGSFDCVIASLILHQVRNSQEVVTEAGRALRLGGRLLVRTVTPEAARQWIPHRFFPSIAQAQADRMPSINDLTDCITRAGFGNIDTENVVHAKRLQPEEVERSFRRDVADRYPFVDDKELDRGLQRMRAHSTARRDDWIAERSFSFLIAEKPRDSHRVPHQQGKRRTDEHQHRRGPAGVPSGPATRS
jgi:ubiquinone/menaquinone biosynthesis C-methylase UbiE